MFKNNLTSNISEQTKGTDGKEKNSEELFIPYRSPIVFAFSNQYECNEHKSKITISGKSHNNIAQ